MLIHLYLSNAESILRYGSKPDFVVANPIGNVPPSERFEGCAWLYLRDIEIPDDVIPPVDTLTARTVDCLRKSIAKKRAECESECREVENRIQTYLAIRYDGGLDQ